MITHHILYITILEVSTFQRKNLLKYGKPKQKMGVELKILTLTIIHHTFDNFKLN